MAPTKMKLRVRKKQTASAKSSQPLAPRPETSPDSKCPICLDRFVNVASVERCLHRFCFRCIREWAKNKAECPLCKQPFRSIFHSVRAENDFKEYVLESSVEVATTSTPAAVTASTATVVTPPAAQFNPDDATSRTRRSRVTRTRARRSQRTQDPTPSGSSVNEVALQRLLPWLQRDRVMGVTPNELHPFLLARTLHELMSFARSIEAMQCPPAPSYEEDSGSQSSIINISEDDDSEEVGITEDVPVESVPSVPLGNSSEISLSQSAWDDETPGPSYSTLSQLPTEPGENQSGGTTISITEQHERTGAEEEEDEEECMIVGYVKPMAERTPELVQLSSDSTEEEEKNESVGQMETQDVTKTEPSPLVQTQTQPPPKSYPSTSQSENLPSHRRRKEPPRGRGFRNRSSSDSSVQSGSSGRPSHNRSGTRERKRRGHRMLGLSSSSSSDDAGYALSVPSPSFSLWDSPEGQKSREDKRKRRRLRRRDRKKERSRSPHHHGNRALSLRSSSSSSTDSRPEKPAGKRKYKTRHLERSSRRQSAGKPRERERSPSVEIIFEKRSSDAPPHSHRWRRNRHKKRSRRKAKVQNSPTIITIDSDSDPTLGHGHNVDYQEPLTEDYLTDYKSPNNQNHHKDKLTDFINQLSEFQDQSTGAPDLTAQPKDRGHTVDHQGCVTDSRTTDHRNNCTAKVTDYKHWVNADHVGGGSDSQDLVPGGNSRPDCVSDPPNSSDSVGGGARGDRCTTDHINNPSGFNSRTADRSDRQPKSLHHRFDSADHDLRGNDHSSDSIDQVSEGNTPPADSLNSDAKGDSKSSDGTDGATDCNKDSEMQVGAHASPHKGGFGGCPAGFTTSDSLNPDAPLHSLNLKNRLLDSVQSKTHLSMPKTPLSETQLLELQDARSHKAEPQLDILGVDQKEDGLSPRDQSDSEGELDRTSSLLDDSDLSSDV